MNPEAGGISLLRPVPLQELRLRADPLMWAVDQKLADLDSLTPVRGHVRAQHHGSVLEVEGMAETIVTVCCDRCLQHFNRPLRALVHELLELEGSDLTAMAGSAAGTGAPRARFRPTGSGSGASGSSGHGGRAAGRPPAAGRDRGLQNAAAGSDLSSSRSSGQGQAPGSGNASRPGNGLSSGNAANPGSQARRGSRSRSQPEPLLIEVLDDRLDPRGDFDPERWLFEQLSLQLPVVNRCGADCPGPPLPLPLPRPPQLPLGDWPASPGANANGSAARPRANQPKAVHVEDRRAPAPAPTGQRVALDASEGSGCAHTSSPVDGTPDATKLPAGCEATKGSRGESGGDPRPSQTPIDPRWAALRQLLP